MTNQQYYSDIYVFCDEQSDKELFLQLQKISPLLSQISHIDILPKGAHRTGLPEKLLEVTNDDRSDFVFLYRNIPFLIIECTEHGYTGDNPKQRFVRFSESARMKIPFIYFTPFSRVRDDEIDSERNASKRSVNTDVWKGMSKLTEIYKIPIVPIEWKLASNQKPRKLGVHPSAETITAIYGELVTLVEIMLNNFLDEIVNQIDITKSKLIQPYIKKTSDLGAVSNTRGSDVYHTLEREQLISLVNTPSKILNYVPRDDYFYKGKGAKLVALTCIDLSSIEWIVTPDNTVSKTDNPAESISNVLNQKIFKSNLVYYTGYEWRSDPHCGVAVLLDLLECISQDGSKREKTFILHYPRAFFSTESKSFQDVKKSINEPYKPTSAIYKNYVARYGKQNALTEINKVFLDKNSQLKDEFDLIGVWSDKTKQARVFRNYCDLIILSDAIILGNRWKI